jgi:hypothetical protein
VAGTAEVAADGAVAVVAGMAGFAAAITEVAGFIRQVITAGTADGAGGAVVGTRGGLFQSLTLIHIMATVLAMGMDMARDTAMGMDRVTVTEEDTDLERETAPGVGLETVAVYGLKSANSSES